MVSARGICHFSESVSNIAYSARNVKLTISIISFIIAAMLDKNLIAKHHHDSGVNR